MRSHTIFRLLTTGHILKLNAPEFETTTHTVYYQKPEEVDLKPYTGFAVGAHTSTQWQIWTGPAGTGTLLQDTNKDSTDLQDLDINFPYTYPMVVYMRARQYSNDIESDWSDDLELNFEYCAPYDPVQGYEGYRVTGWGSFMDAHALWVKKNGQTNDTLVGSIVSLYSNIVFSASDNLYTVQYSCDDDCQILANGEGQNLVLVDWGDSFTDGTKGTPGVHDVGWSDPEVKDVTITPGSYSITLNMYNTPAHGTNWTSNPGASGFVITEKTSGTVVLDTANWVSSTPSLNYHPAYHISPYSSWLNDPQRPLWYNNTWNLWYLWNKDYPTGNGTEWRHVTSTDLINFTDVGVSIPKYTTAHGDPWTGSTIVDTNNTAGFGAGAVIALMTMPADGAGSQSTARWVCTDGSLNFYFDSIVMTNPNANNSNISDKVFRDPKVFWHNESSKWIMTLAEIGKISIYTSTDTKTWVYASALENSDLGTMECPDLFQMNTYDLSGNSTGTSWVMMAGGNGSSSGMTTGSVYWFGSFDGTTFTPSQSYKWLDHGSDFYAGTTFSTSNDSTSSDTRHMIAWNNNWSYAASSPDQSPIGQLSLIRTISAKTVNGTGVLYSTPVSNQSDEFASSTVISDQTITDDFITLPYSYADAYWLNLNIGQDNGAWPSSVVITTHSNGTNYTTITITPSTGTISIDRSKGGWSTTNSDWNTVRSTTFTLGSSIPVSLYVDRKSIEVFLNNGEVSMSSLVFAPAGSTSFSVKVNGSGTISGSHYSTTNKWNIGNSAVGMFCNGGSLGNDGMCHCVRNTIDKPTVSSSMSPIITDTNMNLLGSDYSNPNFTPHVSTTWSLTSGSNKSGSTYITTSPVSDNSTTNITSPTTQVPHTSPNTVYATVSYAGQNGLNATSDEISIPVEYCQPYEPSTGYQPYRVSQGSGWGTDMTAFMNSHAVWVQKDGQENDILVGDIMSLYVSLTLAGSGSYKIEYSCDDDCQVLAYNSSTTQTIVDWGDTWTDGSRGSPGLHATGWVTPVTKTFSLTPGTYTFVFNLYNDPRPGTEWSNNPGGSGFVISDASTGTVYTDSANWPSNGTATGAFCNGGSLGTDGKCHCIVNTLSTPTLTSNANPIVAGTAFTLAGSPYSNPEYTSHSGSIWTGLFTPTDSSGNYDTSMTTTAIPNNGSVVSDTASSGTSPSYTISVADATAAQGSSDRLSMRSTLQYVGANGVVSNTSNTEYFPVEYCAPTAAITGSNAYKVNWQSSTGATNTWNQLMKDHAIWIYYQGEDQTLMGQEISIQVSMSFPAGNYYVEANADNHGYITFDGKEIVSSDDMVDSATGKAYFTVTNTSIGTDVHTVILNAMNSYEPNNTTWSGNPGGIAAVFYTVDSSGNKTVFTSTDLWPSETGVTINSYYCPGFTEMNPSTKTCHCYKPTDTTG